jgi:hypothetical protein
VVVSLVSLAVVTLLVQRRIDALRDDIANAAEPARPGTEALHQASGSAG